MILCFGMAMFNHAHTKSNISRVAAISLWNVWHLLCSSDPLKRVFITFIFTLDNDLDQRYLKWRSEKWLIQYHQNAIVITDGIKKLMEEGEKNEKHVWSEWGIYGTTHIHTHNVSNKYQIYMYASFIKSQYSLRYLF